MQPPPDRPHDATENQDFSVTPAGDQTKEQGTVSQFTFSGITTETVDIALVGCENIDTDKNGTSTFPNSSNPGGNGNVANFGGADTANDITVVNGVAGNQGQFADDVTVNNGSVSFTVDNVNQDCYVAVVFSDADNDDRLDLGTDNQPTEDFANTGDVNVIAPEAQDNDTTIGQVDSVDKAADRFSTATETFFYDSNDEFILAGSPNATIDMAQFEERLSAGDTVTGNYRNDPANQSTFTLDDSAPTAPTAVATQQPTGDNAGKQGLEVTFTESTTPSVASYQVFRATATQPAITGQQVECPAQDSGQFNQVGTVADGDGNADSETFKFFDSTAQPPADGSSPANPQYCYFVVSVDETGDTGPRSNTAGPAQAFQAAPPAAADNPTFTGASAATNTITVQYSEALDCATVAANGSDFTASFTENNNTTANNPTSAVCSNVDHDADPTTPEVGEVVLTVPTAQPSGSTVVVRSTTGSDSNTVGDAETPQEFQVVGDAVQATAS